MTQTIARLMKELASLEKNPLIRGNAIPVGDDVYNWKLNVVGEKPFDFPIRIHLEFPKDYPNSAPKAYFETKIVYTNGATIYDEKGRQSVCLNIFGNFAHVHTEWKTQVGTGWTPAYTVETIILSIQGLMMSEMLSTRPEHIEEMRSSALAFKCPETGHDGSDPAKYWPQVIYKEQAKTDQTEIDEKQYICYVLKEFPPDRMLGYGISIAGKVTKMLSSPCEFLSHEAYNAGFRQSSINVSFTHWLPIITPYKSWNDIKKLFFENAQEIYKSMGEKYDGILSPMNICFSIMNSLVVEIMNQKNNLTVNDKFIDGYFMFYRILKEHFASNPSLINNIDKRIKEFISNSNNRTKTKVPNLGEFILYPLCSNNYGWKDISKEFVEECDARCVFWYVQGSFTQPGRCRDLKDARINPRAVRVFDATETSRHLVCYQKQFLTYAKKISIEEIDKNRGFVSDSMKKEIKDFYNQITKIKSWNDHFTYLEMPLPQNRDAELVNALNISLKNGYHK